MAGPVLDSLSDTLLSDVSEPKSKTDKPKVKQTFVHCYEARLVQDTFN